MWTTADLSIYVYRRLWDNQNGLWTNQRHFVVCLAGPAPSLTLNEFFRLYHLGITQHNSPVRPDDGRVLRVLQSLECSVINGTRSRHVADAAGSERSRGQRWVGR